MISTILSKIIDFLLASTVFILFLFIYHQPLTINVLWFIPIFAVQQIFTYGLSLILSAINLFYRDIQYVLSLILTIGMYLTPVIYPTEIFPSEYRWIFQLNPMAVIINAYRQAILVGGVPNLLSLSIAFVVSSVITLLGYRLFKNSKESSPMSSSHAPTTYFFCRREQPLRLSI